jgi:phage gpG-like protein
MSTFSFKVTRDDISPALSKLAATVKNPIAIFRAMGTTFKSITEGNFNSVGSQLRAKSWPAKRDGSPSNLKKSGTLSTSFHLEVSASHARVSNPMIYAATHQFGARGHVAGKVTGRVKTKFANKLFAGSWQDVMQGGKGIPPRPYFPVTESGQLTPAAEQLIARAGERAIARQAAQT